MSTNKEEKIKENKFKEEQIINEEQIKEEVLEYPEYYEDVDYMFEHDKETKEEIRDDYKFKGNKTTNIDSTQRTGK